MTGTYFIFVSIEFSIGAVEGTSLGHFEYLVLVIRLITAEEFRPLELGTYLAWHMGSQSAYLMVSGRGGWDNLDIGSCGQDGTCGDLGRTYLYPAYNTADRPYIAE